MPDPDVKIDWKQYDPHRCEGAVLSVGPGGALFRADQAHQMLLKLLPQEPAPRPGPASVLLYVQASDTDMLAPTPEELVISQDHRLTQLTGDVKSVRRGGQDVLARASLPYIVEFAEYYEWLEGMIDGQVLKVPVDELYGVAFRATSGASR